MLQKTEPYQAYFSVDCDTNSLLREKTCYLWCLKIIPGQRFLSNQFHLSLHTRTGVSAAPPQTSWLQRWSHFKEQFSKPTHPLDSQTELSCSHPGLSLQTERDPLCRRTQELGLPVLLSKNWKSINNCSRVRVFSHVVQNHTGSLWLAVLSLPIHCGTVLAAAAASSFSLQQCSLSRQLFSHHFSIMLFHPSYPHNQQTKYRCHVTV